MWRCGPLLCLLVTGISAGVAGRAIPLEAGPQIPAPQPESAPAQPAPPAPVIENRGAPMAVPVRCGEEELQLAATDCPAGESCPVYLELSAVEGVASRIFAAGNLHSVGHTLSSILLASEDGGKTWFEPFARTPGAALEAIQFIDFASGWIAGQTVAPRPRDPFFLVTSDGGRTWRQRAVFDEPRPAIIEGFRFVSAKECEVWIDAGPGVEEEQRYELYETRTGGESWMLRRISDQPLGKPSVGDSEGAWRVRANAGSKSYLIESLKGGQWVKVAAFLVQPGECQMPEPVLREPPPEEPPPPAPAAETAPVTPSKKAKPKPPSLRKTP